MPRAAPATRSQRFRSQSEFSDSSQRSNLFCTIMCFSSEALEVFVRIYEGVHVFKTTPIFRRSSRLQEPIVAHLPSLQSTIPAQASTIQNPAPLDVSNNCNQCLFLQPMSFFGNPPMLSFDRLMQCTRSIERLNWAKVLHKKSLSFADKLCQVLERESLRSENSPFST